MSQHPFSFLQNDQILTEDLASVEHYSKDWTKQFKIDSTGVLFPKTTEEVSQIVKTAFEHNISSNLMT